MKSHLARMSNKESISGGPAINIGMDGSVTCMAMEAVFDEDE